MRRFLPALAAAALITAGCGYIGGPQPPLANIPSDITDLAAVQHGARIVAQFSVPLSTTEGFPIKPPLELDLRIGVASDPFDLNQWAGEATRIPPGPVSEGIARYEILSAAWTGKRAAIAVRAVGSNGRESHWSKAVFVAVVPPPETPADLHAEATAQGVRLTWRARGALFRILRRSGSTPYAEVAEARQPEWTDLTAEYGTKYTYRVQTLVDLGDRQKAESDLSDEVPITPEDTFPPGAPTGLRAVAAPRSIELSWDRNPEPDLAGYRIYRAAGSGELIKIADTGEIPSYSDPNVEPGKTYRYTVTAFDRANNESAHSSLAEATIQP